MSAFLFGSERYGMRNEDVYRCHAALRIPVSPEYGSLNLASAIQVIAYEWRMALGGFDLPRRRRRRPPTPRPWLACCSTGSRPWWRSFLDPAAPKKLCRV